MSTPEVYIKIGVFDSGRGGRLMAKAMQAALPQVKIIFKSDPAYFPYGNKSASVILDRLIYFTRRFQKLNCHLIVIACNSATTSAISQLRRRFPDLNFVGIEPPIKPIVKLTRTGQVAVIGTTATIASARRRHLAAKFARGVKIEAIACPGLAEAIESNPRPRPETKRLLRQFLDQPLAAGVDVIGLACTHYPYLLSQMQSLYPRVTFYDPAAAVVARVVKLAHDSVG